MEWWNDIWLNEGFAKYMEFISVEATYPELRIVRDYYLQLMYMFKSDRENIEELLLCTFQQDEYLLDTCFAAFGYDSMNSSRPICSPAETPIQIEQMFDTISYDKVCKMILSVELLHGNLGSFLIFISHSC